MKIHVKQSQILQAQTIIDQMVVRGVDYAVFASGYRSTPLMLALMENSHIKCVSHFDERGLAFHALGYARATGKPALILITSGTAVANLYPAVVEASMDEVPMIVLSSDRPEELLNCGANQAINQVEIFAKYPRYFLDVPVLGEETCLETLRSDLDFAIDASVGFYAGPVHINSHWREPFEIIAPKGNANRRVEQWNNGILDNVLSCDGSLSAGGLIVRLDTSGIILVANGLTSEDETAIIELSEKLGWPILPDITSSLRLYPRSQNVISYYDQLLLNPESISCDVLLQFGRRFVSKRLLQWISQQDLKSYTVVAPTKQKHDPTACVTEHLVMSAKNYCKNILSFLKGVVPREVGGEIFSVSLDECGAMFRIEAGSVPEIAVLAGSIPSCNDKLAWWKEHSQAIQTSLDQYFESHTDLNEIAIIRNIVKNINAKHGLFIANSMPIRDMDMYAPIINYSIPLACNRGASGIDGIISTAIGYAQGLENPVTLITGDLTFLHDVNALASLKKSTYSLCIIVINNDGGGIFSMLPIYEELDKKTFESIYGTPHGLDLQAVTESFGLKSKKIQTMDDLIETYLSWQNTKGNMVIELSTNREENRRIHQDLKSLCLSQF
jgi:2-succinyl-5-enolpyruvyl-6-hydroxy-3-cyclohexene-1-carboxylate synthase